MADPILNYLAFLHLAENDPVAALQQWIDEVGPTLSGGAGALEAHERGLARLLQIARDAASPANSGAVEEKALVASGLITKARRALRVRQSSRSETISFGDEADAGAKPARHLPGQLVEVVELNRRASSWTKAVGLQWLVGAALTLRNRDKPPHLAFLPLRLYPGGRYVEQAAGALCEAEDADLRVTATLRDVLEANLSRIGDFTALEREIDATLWKLYSEIRPGAHASFVAQRYLDRLSRLGADDELRDPAVVEALSAAVANSSMSNETKAAFFRRWRRTQGCWQRSVTPFWFLAEMSDIATARHYDGKGDRKFADAWGSLRGELGGRAFALLTDAKWGAKLRAAMAQALGRDLPDEGGLDEIGREVRDEDPATIRMEDGILLEEAELFAVAAG